MLVKKVLMRLSQIVLTMLLIMMLSTAFANPRPTIHFAGVTYYLQKSYNEVDNNHSPVNVVEFYLPAGETADNYTSYIKRVTLLLVSDYKEAARSQLHEHLEDNKNIPYEIVDDPERKRVILNVTFWWPFRPTVITKELYIFQMDKNINHVMYYLVGEDDYYNASSISNADLIKKGKSLLLDSKLVNEAKEISF